MPLLGTWKGWCPVVTPLPISLGAHMKETLPLPFLLHEHWGQEVENSLMCSLPRRGLLYPWTWPMCIYIPHLLNKPCHFVSLTVACAFNVFFKKQEPRKEILTLHILNSELKFHTVILLDIVGVLKYLKIILMFKDTLIFLSYEERVQGGRLETIY